MNQSVDDQSNSSQENAIEEQFVTVQDNASPQLEEFSFHEKMRGGLLGVKVGMAQVYSQSGDAVAVTVIQIKPNVITQVKTQKKEGYQALQVGILSKKIKSTTCAERGHLKKSGQKGFYHYQEIRLDSDQEIESSAVGKMLSLEFLKEGSFVDLSARSKGKGFQGGVKRYHMAGGNKTHGASLSHRQLGSIGNRADPAKCFKNKKMAGQMGNKNVTVQNVRVVKVDLEQRLVLVHGSVPGSRSGLVTIRPTVKNVG